jgi:hypothetical protein
MSVPLGEEEHAQHQGGQDDQGQRVHEDPYVGVAV